MMREKDTSLLSVERVSKTFHAGTVDERVALTDVSLKLLPGDFAVVVGGNGAGKSTFLNMLAGEVISDTGVISIDGRVITTLPTHRRAKYISRVFQDPSIGTAAALSLATLMVTHNMHHAIDYGNRLIMMRDGRIVGDLTGEAKRAMTMERLMATFNDEPPMAQTVNA
jgi:ABC-type uncharacterized transport system ATPase component